MITHQNIEEYLIRFVENDLNHQEKAALERFLQQHTEYREELIAFQDTVLQPPSEIIYEHKKQLLRGDSQSRIVLFPLLWRVAAVLVLIVSLIAAYYFSTNSNKNIPVELVSVPDNTNNPISPTQSESANEVTVQKGIESPAMPVSKNNKPAISKQLIVASNQVIQKNLLTPVTNPIDTTPNLQSTNETMIVQAPIMTQAPIQAEALIQEPVLQPTPTKHITRLDKNLHVVSRWLRRNGKDKLATGVDYVAQLKDKEIEISYTSRYIHFQKSFSLSKL